MGRLWERNLGRDDRIISSHGKELRLPFLDEDLVQFVHHAPLHLLVDLNLPTGEGDKKVLRDVVRDHGLVDTSTLTKRAIQFGSRIAKKTNISLFGSHRKGKGQDEVVHLMKPSQEQEEQSKEKEEKYEK